VIDLALLIGMLAAGVRLATPIALAALGETLAQRSGVINVGIEGIMLVGAFLAVLFAVITGSPWGGLAAAIVGGAALGGVHALLAVRLKIDQIVAGIALIFLGLGISGYGYRLTLGRSGAMAAVPGFEPADIPGLTDLPVIGPLLFGQHILVYVTIMLAILLAWMFRATRLGLVIKAVGENPAAADALGTKVPRVRALCVIAGGAFAGAGGAFLSIAQLTGFVENMVAGRGFIAIACVVLARWNPLGVILVALVFGVADAAQIRMQALFPEIPYQFFTIAPYLVALLSFVIFAGRSAMPAALGKPFDRER
jgi:general nucleoside transport system permease protein